jgi:tetratricopeptide (TPR) repeat protein
MTKTALLSVVLFAAACGKKAEEKKAPEPAPKMVEKQPKEPVAAPAKLTITSKSPDAVKEFEAGQALAIAARGDEATPHFKKALELDPEFARAMAAVGLNTPGSEGTDMLAKAGQLAANLPDGEKAVIEGQMAMRAGDPVKARERFEHALSVAPGEWWLDLTLSELSNGRDDAASLKYSEDAIKLNPTAAQPYNIMAYTYARQKDWDKAITAAKKQVELAPSEPNPVDSLAEIEMWSGKFDDADKDFVKATTVDANFTLSWQGAELARAYKGDFKGAYEANDKFAAGTGPGQKFDAMLDKAWLQFAEGKLPDALKTIDAVEKDAAAQKLPVYAWAGLDRAAILAQGGKLADAKKVLADIDKRADQLAGDGR